MNKAKMYIAIADVIKKWMVVNAKKPIATNTIRALTGDLAQSFVDADPCFNPVAFLDDAGICKSLTKQPIEFKKPFKQDYDERCN